MSSHPKPKTFQIVALYGPEEDHEKTVVGGNGVRERHFCSVCAEVNPKAPYCIPYLSEASEEKVVGAQPGEAGYFPPGAITSEDGQRRYFCTGHWTMKLTLKALKTSKN